MNIEVIFKGQFDIKIFDIDFYQHLLENIRKLKKSTKDNNNDNKSFLSEA